MFHREAGVFKTTYAADMSLFPLPVARKAIAVICVLLGAFIPLVCSEYDLSQFNLIFIAVVGALGLNILVGYTGQISIGHGAFMSVGAYEVSDDGRYLAYSTDVTGFRQYTLHVKDLVSGEIQPERRRLGKGAHEKEAVGNGILGNGLPQLGDQTSMKGNRQLFGVLHSRGPRQKIRTRRVQMKVRKGYLLGRAFTQAGI